MEGAPLSYGVILAIETSCDDTCAAVVTLAGLDHQVVESAYQALVGTENYRLDHAAFVCTMPWRR